MNNIYTEISTILSEDYINLTYEVSELVDAGVLSVSVVGGQVGTVLGDITQKDADAIVERYKLLTLLPSFGVDLSLIGYVIEEEFFLFSVIVRGEEKEMSPKRRAYFVELLNSNPDGVIIKHVPVMQKVLSISGAKVAISEGKPLGDVMKMTIQDITGLCGGVSRLTGRGKKGLVFKSFETDYSFKAYSEQFLMQMV